MHSNVISTDRCQVWQELQHLSKQTALCTLCTSAWKYYARFFEILYLFQWLKGLGFYQVKANNKRHMLSRNVSFPPLTALHVADNDPVMRIKILVTVIA